MPARSKSQQRLFGMVHAYQKGELEDASESIKAIAKSISKEDAKHFANTKHKGLPEKKAYEIGFMEKCTEYGVAPEALVKIAKSISEYLFDVSQEPVYGESGNGIGDTYIMSGEASVIKRFRKPDGSTIYRVERNIPTPFLNELGRPINSTFSVVVDSPYKAMRLAKGNISFDQETNKLLGETRRTIKSLLQHKKDFENLVKQIPEISEYARFDPPKRFGLRVTRPGINKTVNRVFRYDFDLIPNDTKKVLKSKTISGKAKLIAGGVAAVPVLGGSLYAMLRNKRKKTLKDKILDLFDK